MVCVHKLIDVEDAFGKIIGDYRPLNVFVKERKNWKLIKDGVRHKRIRLPEGINLNLYITEEDNWGNAFLIKTGSEEFSKWIMETRTRQIGLLQAGGYLWKEGQERLKCPEEIDVFKLLKMEYVEPEIRNIYFVIGIQRAYEGYAKEANDEKHNKQS